MNVTIGLVLWRANNHLTIIYLFLFCRSANEFGNHRYIVVDTLSSLRCTTLHCQPTILPYYFQFIIYARAQALH